jgi:hypothetical protein
MLALFQVKAIELMLNRIQSTLQLYLEWSEEPRIGEENITPVEYEEVSLKDQK